MLNVYTKCIQVCTMFNHVYTLSNTYTQGYSTDIPRTCPNILGIYQKFRISPKNITAGLEPMTSCILASCLDHYATSVIDSEQLLQVICTLLPWHAGWCRTYGAGYSAPPGPVTVGRHTDGILQCIAAQPAPCARAIQLDSARVVSVRCRAASESLRSTRIPSQTARLVPSHKIQIGAIASTLKLFVWAGITIKTFGTTKFEEVKTRVQENAEDTTSHSWNGRTPFAVQCFLLSYSDWLSVSRIVLPLHKSLGRRNM